MLGIQICKDIINLESYLSKLEIVLNLELLL